MLCSFVFHTHQNKKYLEESLLALNKNLTNENEVIFIFDNTNSEIFDTVQKFIDSKKQKNFKFIFFNETQGHAFSYNEALKIARGDFVFYLGSNVILNETFFESFSLAIKRNPNADVISFNNVNKLNKEISEFTSMDSDIKYNLTTSIRDKVFSKKFLINNGIYLNNFKYYPILFLYKILKTFKLWVMINKNLCEFKKNDKFSYNLYDIFEMNEELIKNEGHTDFFKKNKDPFDYLMIMYASYVFLTKINIMYDNKKIYKIAKQKSKLWLKQNIIGWRENKILNSDKLTLNGRAKKFILNGFKMSLLK